MVSLLTVGISRLEKLYPEALRKGLKRLMLCQVEWKLDQLGE